MTTKEAIEMIKQSVDVLMADTQKRGSKAIEDAMKESLDALEKKLSELEKQLPKKPKNGLLHPCCPVCNEEVVLFLGVIGDMEYKMNYCSECGQAIDWSVQK